MAQHGFLLAVGVKTITVLSYWGESEDDVFLFAVLSFYETKC